MAAQRVLIWIYVDTHFREMFRVARLLKARTSFSPVFLFQYAYPRLAEDLAHCLTEGFPYHYLGDDVTAYNPTVVYPADSSGPGDEMVGNREKTLVSDNCSSVPATLPQKRTGFLRRAYATVRRSWLGDGLVRLAIRSVVGVSVLIYMLHFWRLLRRARRVLQLHEPALLLFPEDNVEYDISAFIKAGKERGISSIIIPFTLANAQEPAEAYWNNPRSQVCGLYNRLVAFFFPRWVHEHKGRRLLRLTAGKVVALEWLGLAPPLPWVFNSGYARVVVLESEAVRDYYVRAGLPPEQLRVLGSLRQDELAEYRQQARKSRQRLLSSLGLADDRPLILCALPPNQYPELRPGCEFSRYEDLLEYWAQTLGSLSNCHVVVNPHPRIRIPEISHLEKWGIRIVPGDIARLVPLCDLFVASVSATICMALACGKPVLNYDVYRFGYDDFAQAAGVTTVASKTEFAAALRAALVGIDFPPLFSQNQDENARYWGLLDGKARERFLELMAEFISAPGERAAA